MSRDIKEIFFILNPTGPEVMVNFTTNGVVGIETKIHDPVTGDWVTTSTKVWNGSTWNVTVFKTWNGSAWV
jgi:hypothetical protein